jgi:hypothetical protein
MRPLLAYFDRLLASSVTTTPTGAALRSLSPRLVAIRAASRRASPIWLASATATHTCAVIALTSSA